MRTPIMTNPPTPEQKPSEGGDSRQRIQATPPEQGLTTALHRLVKGLEVVFTVFVDPLLRLHKCPQCKAPVTKYAEAEVVGDTVWSKSWVYQYKCRICDYTWGENYWDWCWWSYYD